MDTSSATALALSGPPNILLVDDEPEVAATVADILRQDGCVVEVVADARQALRALERRTYDVLLTEMTLAETDGINLLAHARRRIPGTRCIVLTGYASLESAVSALRHGAYDYLVKPCVIEDLQRTVARAVEQRRLTLLAAERERQLRELNDQLEERVRLRTAELTKANHCLAEANETKDRFLAILSHELRTPLTPLRAGLDLLWESAPSTLKAVLDSMNRSLAQEARLIDDLLDVARISAGKLAIDKRGIDPAACLRAAVEMIRPRAQARSQTLDLQLEEPLPTLLADPVRLQQVVANLLDNAVKFSPMGGRVALGAWVDKGRLFVRVTDTGPGIDPAFLPHAFEPFRQADSSSRRQHGGLGLGLAIAHQIVALHQGVLQAANAEPGPGARFTFSFPIVPATREVSGLPPPAPSRLRVLLVDDSVDTIDMMARLLELKGLKVSQARSVPEALSQALTEVPDVVVTDIGMPGQDGYDLLRLLQADDQLCEVPVVAATGYVGSQEQEQMAHAGFAAALSKPFDLAQLLDTLRRVCPGSRAP